MTRVSLTKEMVHAGKTGSGGWKRKQTDLVAPWDTDNWPPASGWIDDAIAYWAKRGGIPVDTYIEFLDSNPNRNLDIPDTEFEEAYQLSNDFDFGPDTAEGADRNVKAGPDRGRGEAHQSLPVQSSSSHSLDQPTSDRTSHPDGREVEVGPVETLGGGVATEQGNHVGSLSSTVIVSPTEPTQLRAIGITDLTPESYGADILIPANGYFLGVQRKVFPADFLASLYDGRLSTSLVKLTKLAVRVLILEGKPAWTTSGFLVSNDYGYQNFSRSQLRNLLLSAHSELGVHTVWTDNLTDTIDTIRDLVRWGQKNRHDSVFERADPSKLDRRQWTTRDQAIFVLQGFDGIGPELARRIYDHFGRIPLRWDTDMASLEDVVGIGPHRAAKLKELFK